MWQKASKSTEKSNTPGKALDLITAREGKPHGSGP